MACSSVNKNVQIYFTFVLSLLILPGCLTTNPDKDKNFFFMPDKPELPRLQFIKTLRGSDDIVPPKSKFDSFLTGASRKKFLDKPYGIGMHDGKLYVCDTNTSVFVFDYKNKGYYRLPGAKGTGALIEPMNIGIAENGYKYVADPFRKQVVAFDAKDFYVRAYGTGTDWKPIAAAPLDDFLYVTDAKNNAVQVFNIKSGKMIKTIGRKGPSEEQLHKPITLAFDSNKILYVVDALRFEIVKYDRDGHYLGTISGHGKSVGRVARPRGIAIDKKNRIYIVDASFNNVQIFHESGQVLLPWGWGGRRKGTFYMPAGIAIDYDNIEYFRDDISPDFEVEYLVFVTNQFGGNSINVFGYGKEKGVEYPSYDELLKEAKEKEDEAQKMLDLKGEVEEYK